MASKESALARRGGTHGKVLSETSKEIWDYLLTKGDSNYSRKGALKKETNFQSRAVKETSKWKLDLKVF